MQQNINNNPVGLGISGGDDEMIGNEQPVHDDGIDQQNATIQDGELGDAAAHVEPGSQFDFSSDEEDDSAPQSEASDDNDEASNPPQSEGAADGNGDMGVLDTRFHNAPNQGETADVVEQSDDDQDKPYVPQRPTRSDSDAWPREAIDRVEEEAARGYHYFQRPLSAVASDVDGETIYNNLPRYKVRGGPPPRKRGDFYHVPSMLTQELAESPEEVTSPLSPQDTARPSSPHEVSPISSVHSSPRLDPISEASENDYEREDVDTISKNGDSGVPTLPSSASAPAISSLYKPQGGIDWADDDEDDDAKFAEEFRRSSAAGVWTTSGERVPSNESSNTDQSPQQPLIVSSDAAGIEGEDPTAVNVSVSAPNSILQAADDAKQVDESEAPDSPTSSTGSIDSVTGLTVREGQRESAKYQKGDHLGPQDRLAKQRSMLKLINEGNPRVDGLPDDLLHRAALLETQIIKYRTQRNQAWDDMRDVDEDRRRLMDSRDAIHAEKRRVEAETQRAETEFEDLRMKYNGIAVEYETIREAYGNQDAAMKALDMAYKNLFEEHEKAAAESDKFKAQAKKEKELADIERRRRDVGTKNVATSTEDRNRPMATAPRRRAWPRKTPSYGPILEETVVRWPANMRPRVAALMAEWINIAHHRETGYGRTNVMPPLLPEQIETFMGANGLTPFPQLVSDIENAGYVFRPDHFAYEVITWTRAAGQTCLEALHMVRLQEHEADYIRQLLREIDELMIDNERGTRARDPFDPSAMDAQIAQEINDAHEARQEAIEALAECRKHGTALAAQIEELVQGKAEVESAMKEMSEQLVSSENGSATHSPEVDQKELDLLRTQLSQAQEQVRTLQADLQTQQEAYKLLQTSYEEQERRIQMLKQEVDTRIVELAELRKDHNCQSETIKQTDEKNKSLSSQNARLTKLLNQIREWQEREKEAADRLVTTLPAAQPTTPSRPQLSGENLLSPLPRSGPDVPRTPFTPGTPARPARYVQREARLKDSATFQRAAEGLKLKREAREQQQAERRTLQEAAMKKLCGWTEIPYVPDEARLEGWRTIVAAKS